MSEKSEDDTDQSETRSKAAIVAPSDAGRDAVPGGKGMDPVSRVAVLSLLVNLSLVGIKLTLSYISGSLALRADAVHSLVDVFGSTALILGIFISGRKSKSFPYGLYKVENLVAVIISLLLFLTAYEIAVEAAVGASSHVPYGGWVLVAVAAIVPVPLLFGTYEMRIGKKFNSPSLVADGRQFRADVLTELVVFAALAGQFFGLPLDRVAAAIIAVLIVKAGWEILVSGMRVLLDASIDPATLKKIEAAIEANPEVSAVEELTGRNSGRYLFVEAKVAFRITDLARAHQASQRIERDIREAVPNVDRVLIHYEPRPRTHLRYAVALADLEGNVSSHFGESPYFALVDFNLKEKRVEGQKILANPYKDMEKGKGLKVAGFLLSHKPDVVVAGESLEGKGPGYALAEAGVETVKTEAGSLREVVGELNK
jgi:cation diffusion facilitator family transporter